jgi:hypothetical protein
MSPIKFLLASIALGALSFLTVNFGIASGWFSRPSLLTEIIVVNVLATAILYRWLVKIQETPLFINSYLLSIVLKLILYSGLLLTIRIVSPQTLNPNAILLLVCYTLFTLLEVTVLFMKVGS